MSADLTTAESEMAEARHARTLERVRALAPAINVLLHQGHARAEVARTLRTQAGLVLGQAEEVARALRQAADKLEVRAPAGPEGSP